MISISKITADTSGNVIFKEKSSSDIGKKTARVTRTATLDGGVYINHSGYTDGDRTLKIKADIPTDKAVLLTNIFENNTSCLISMSDGLFYGSISALETTSGNLKMTFLIKQKENS